MNNSSGRILVTVVAIVVVGGAVLFLGNRIFWQPYREAQSRLALVTEEVESAEKKIHDLDLDKASLAKWNKLSLPANPDRAAAEYGKMLKPLLRDCGLVVKSFEGPPPQKAGGVGTQKRAKHVSLLFQVQAKGTIESVARTLEALQRMPVMHRVKKLTVDRLEAKDRTGDLGVIMTIEAMIVEGANNQPRLGGLDSIGPPMTARKYSEVALRNPFIGALPPPAPPPPKKVEPPPVVVEEPPGPDVLEYIRIDTIVPTSQEAYLRNMLFESRPMKVSAKPRSGYDFFVIKNKERTRDYVRGKVLRIGERDIYFQVGEEVFGFHFGQNLAEAMRRPLNDAQMESLELTALVDPDFAKEAADAKKGTKGKTTKKGR